MKKLSTQEHVSLTENVLKNLAQNRITTISEFLQEDVEKLSILSTLKLPEILDIRNHIILSYSAPFVNGATLWSNSLAKKKTIPTYIQSLDAVLEGGIPVGCITELIGLAGSGKTQLCFQFAINCAKSDCSVLYIDTKGDFSAVRIMKIMEAHGSNYEEMAKVMSIIQVVHVWTMKEAVELLKIVKSGVINNLGLLIIDSLPTLMFQHLGSLDKIGLTLLNELVNNVRFISKELMVAVICVNIQTRWLDHEIADIDDEEDSNVIKDSFVEKRNRCLGKYWRHIPSKVIVIEKSENKYESNNSYQIQVEVHNSRLPKQFQKCTLKLDNMGVCLYKIVLIIALFRNSRCLVRNLLDIYPISIF